MKGSFIAASGKALKESRLADISAKEKLRMAKGWEKFLGSVVLRFQKHMMSFLIRRITSRAEDSAPLLGIISVFFYPFGNGKEAIKTKRGISEMARDPPLLL